MFRARNRQPRWPLGLLSTLAVFSGIATGCSGKTQQKSDTTPNVSVSGSPGTAGAANVAGSSSAVGGSGDMPGVSGNATAAAGAGGAPTAGTAGHGAGGEPSDGELLPNQFPLPAFCAEPRPTAPPLLDTPSGCAAGCREVVAFALEGARGCIDTNAGQLVTCSCGALKFGTNNSEACLKTKDGRRWLVVRGNELGMNVESSSADPPATFDAAVWSQCSEQDKEALRVAQSCDFEVCEYPSQSHCGLNGTNAGLWTTSCEHKVGTTPGYDYNGCLKPSCEADQDCASNERCVRGVGVMPACTFDSEANCNCGTSQSSDFDPAVCVDVDTAGPRGPWEHYRAHDLDRKVVWDLYPDGKLLITARGEVKQAQVSAEHLAYLNEELNGYTIRAGMQNGFICPTTSGFPGNLTLVVAGKTYARDLTGCFFDLPLTFVLRQYGL